MFKRITSICLVLLMLLSTMSFMSFAEVNGNFSDVSEDHWANDAIDTMVELGVINGYGDGSFKPNKEVSRAEFAKMMVIALQLDVNKNAKSSFLDLEEDHWVTPYVETAKSYLTGYRSSDGFKFKPDEDAVREDMAVALVKALDYDSGDAKLSVLEQYEDYKSISEDLRPYVAKAIELEIMQGEVKDGKKYFNPVDSLTRAQSAVLLLNVIDEEKIVFDEEKVVLDGEATDPVVDTPVVENGDFVLAGLSKESSIVLEWDVDRTSGLQGFKVVASKSNSSPKYPEDGYIYYLTDTSTRRKEISGMVSNKNGDFTTLTPGEYYYFSITALYDDGKDYSNSIKLKYPGIESQVSYGAPNVTAVAKDGYVQVCWDKIESSNFSGYKVVASKSNSSPMYSADGYMKYITDRNTNCINIYPGASYNGGDVGKFEAGQEYYFSITAVYDGSKVKGNAVKVKMPGTNPPSSDVSNYSLKLSGESKDGYVVLSWTKYPNSGLSGYKVVASKTDGTPVYPENGYYKWITDANTTSITINKGSSYKNGDVGTFESGVTYNFAITYITNSGKEVSNTVQLQIK